MRKGHHIKKVEKNKAVYFHKKYFNDQVARKVSMIHDQLSKMKFPFTLPILRKENSTIIQPWLNDATAANYSAQNDRKKTFEIIQALHSSKQTINWVRMPFLQQQSLIKKWMKRLQIYEQQKLNLPNQLRRKCERVIRNVQYVLDDDFSVERKNLTLCHGDIAHHNFLFTENGSFLIDFDAAYIGDEHLEKVTWIQRVLPSMHYNIDQLFEEIEPWHCPKKYVPFILFPNEVLREVLLLQNLHGENYELRYAYVDNLLDHYLSHEKMFHSALKNFF